MLNVQRVRKIILFTFLTCIPYVVLAQNSANVSQGITTLASLIDTFTNTVVKSLATLFLALALLAFFYGIVKYIWGMREGKAEEVKNGNQFMTWGLVALFIMFSVYGIIKLGQGIFFNGADVTTITIPNINFKSGTSADVLGGGSNNSASRVNTTPSVGSTIKSVNGTTIGTVNASGQVVNSTGNVVGNLNSSGQVIDNSGNTIDTQTRAVDTNYSGCPGGQYDSFGGCDTSGSGTSGSANSTALSEYIKQCKAQDPSKTGTQCWQEYSAQNPTQSTTETAPTSNANGTTPTCPSGATYMPSTDSCFFYIYGCTDKNASNWYPNANTDDGSCTYTANNSDTIDMGQMTHSECTDARTEDSCSTLGSRCQWTSAGTCVDAGL